MPFVRPIPRRVIRLRAFTLIELIVALGVTAVMLTLMINISLNMLKAWNRTGGSLSAGNQARVALDYLSQDLQSAILKRDGAIWLAATVQQNPPGAGGDEGIVSPFNTSWAPVTGGNVKPNASGAPAAGNSLDLGAMLPADANDQRRMENIRFGKAGVWLRLFTTPPSFTLSAPRAVSYMISRGRVGSASADNGQFVYALFRSEVPPQSTFLAGFDITSANYEDVSVSATTGKIRRPTIDDLIANNVIDFGVRLYERDNATGQLYECFPVRRTIAGVGTASNTVPVTYVATSNPATTYTNSRFGSGTILPAGGMPVVAELMVRVLTPEGQRVLLAFEESRTKRPPNVATDAEYWWQLAIENSQVFTRRVEIRSTAL